MDWLAATFPACRVADTCFILRSMRRIASPGSARDFVKTEAYQTLAPPAEEGRAAVRASQAHPQVLLIAAARSVLHRPCNPRRMYAGNTIDVPTIGTRAVLVSSSNQSDELVYSVVKSMFDNFAVFRQLHPALSTLEIMDMVPTDSVIPIHPGALHYYRDLGLIR